MEAHCLQEAAHKLLPVLLVSLAAMMRLALPHLNVLTKSDLMDDKEALLEVAGDPWPLLKQQAGLPGKWGSLAKALA